MYIEIDNTEIRKTSIKQAIKDGFFMVWTPERIKNAFNCGHGTINDFERYKSDNKPFCTIIDISESELNRLYPAYFYA